LRSNRHKVRNAKNVPTGGIVESFNLIKANFEETDTSNRWQLVPDLQGLGGHYQLQLENLDLGVRTRPWLSALTTNSKTIATIYK
jgi:hypothetical protein